VTIGRPPAWKADYTTRSQARRFRGAQAAILGFSACAFRWLIERVDRQTSRTSRHTQLTYFHFRAPARREVRRAIDACCEDAFEKSAVASDSNMASSHTAAARAKGMTEQEYAELVAIVGMAAETNKLVTALGVPVDEVFLLDRTDPI